MLRDGKRPNAMDSVEICHFKTFWESNFAARTFSSLDVLIYMLQCYNMHVNSQLHWAKYKKILVIKLTLNCTKPKRVIFVINLRIVLRLKILNKAGTTLITLWARIINL